MQRKIYKKRLWCEKCKDFTIHDTVQVSDTEYRYFDSIYFDLEGDGEQVCSCCGKQWVAAPIKEMDPEKVALQRERYKNQRRRRFSESMMAFSMLACSNPLFGIFDEVGISKEIIESDAGLLYEERVVNERMVAKRNERNAELQKFSKVNRNDICLCGSGLKYKKCCLKKHKEY
jgi:hypothetical protein